MLIFSDLRYVEQQLLIRVALNILKETKDLCHTLANQWCKHYFDCLKEKVQSHRHPADSSPVAPLQGTQRSQAFRGWGSVLRLPCPARSADPTVWTPAFRLRPCSRSDTAASPCRCAGTVRIPGPSRRAHAPPHSRSRVRDRVRVLTWRSSKRCWNLGNSGGQRWQTDHYTRKSRKCPEPWPGLAYFRVEIRVRIVLPALKFQNKTKQTHNVTWARLKSEKNAPSWTAVPLTIPSGKWFLEGRGPNFQQHIFPFYLYQCRSIVFNLKDQNALNMVRFHNWQLTPAPW